MGLYKLAAFADGDVGGNPAGVYLSEEPLPEAEMQAMAAEIGYSETAFAYPTGKTWRTRYFAPDGEIPFCGHATIALGAVLASEYGNGSYRLILNDAEITVEGRQEGEKLSATLRSPPTSYSKAGNLLDPALRLFGLDRADLNLAIEPVVARAGASHLLLALNDRETLAGMDYDFERGQALMRSHGLATISLLFESGPGVFESRNAFAAGGVYEDPATGAAAAALAGYLRDGLQRPEQRVRVVQGEDMGSRSIIEVEIPREHGGGILVSGKVRLIRGDNDG